MKRVRSKGASLLAKKYDGVKRAWDDETNRGLALVMAAYFDDLLDDLLRRSFIDNSGVADKLLGADRPLSSFSAKIELAYALGFITTPLYKQLHQIREIRNHFAHAGEARDFNDTGIRDRCDTLHSLATPIANVTPRQLHARMKFIAAASLALMELQLWIGKATHAAVRDVAPTSKP